MTAAVSVFERDAPCKDGLSVLKISSRVLSCGRQSLFGGTVSSTNGIRYGLMAGHCAKIGEQCKLANGTVIGKTVAVVNKIIRHHNERQLVDLALVELGTDSAYLLRNFITIMHKKYQLEIAKDQAVVGKRIFAIDDSGKLIHGFVTGVCGEPHLAGCLAVTDYSRRRGFLDRTGCIGAPIMSLSETHPHKAFVHGILVGCYGVQETSDCERSMDIAIPLWDSLQAAGQMESFKVLFGGDIDGIEFFYSSIGNMQQSMRLNTNSDASASPATLGEAFATKWTQLAMKLEVTPRLIHILQDLTIITKDDVEIIHQERGRWDPPEVLLTMLERSDGRKLDALCDALVRSDQPHVAGILRGDVVLSVNDDDDGGAGPCTATTWIRRAFVARTTALSADISFTAELRQELAARRVLTDIQIVECCSTDESRQIFKLLEYVRAGNDEAVLEFIKALAASGQHSVVDKYFDVAERTQLGVPSKTSNNKYSSKPTNVAVRKKVIILVSLIGLICFAVAYYLSCARCPDQYALSPTVCCDAEMIFGCFIGLLSLVLFVVISIKFTRMFLSFVGTEFLKRIRGPEAHINPMRCYTVTRLQTDFIDNAALIKR